MGHRFRLPLSELAAVGAVALCFLWGYRGESFSTYARSFMEESVPPQQEVRSPTPPAVEAPAPPVASSELQLPAPPVVQPEPVPNSEQVRQTMTETLNNLQPPPVEQEEMRRNTYFEKLSEEMKELQGAPPPSPIQTQVPPASGSVDFTQESAEEEQDIAEDSPEIDDEEELSADEDLEADQADEEVIVDDGDVEIEDDEPVGDEGI